MKDWTLTGSGPNCECSRMYASCVLIGPATLRRMYVEELRTTDQIAAHFGCSGTTVRRHPRRFKIPVRPRGPCVGRIRSRHGFAPTFLRWSAGVAYVVGLIATNGNLGRNTFCGPDYKAVDFSLVRNFKAHFLGEAGHIFSPTYTATGRVTLAALSEAAQLLAPQSSGGARVIASLQDVAPAGPYAPALHAGAKSVASILSETSHLYSPVASGGGRISPSILGESGQLYAPSERGTANDNETPSKSHDRGGRHDR